MRSKIDFGHGWRISLAALAWTVMASPGSPQTITDGVMMPPKTLCTGIALEYDQWSDYWEGRRKRDNENIGAVTTRTASWMGSYGVNSRLNVIAVLPYVNTGASQGTLQGMAGLQDLTVGAKYNFLSVVARSGALKAFAVASYSHPVSDYTPDFYPLSIGSHSRRASGRLTVNYNARNGVYANASGAYTRRGNVTLDRPAYYTDGRMYLTDEVQMPAVFDYALSVGYRKGRILAPVSFVQQSTRGGGDIRRQDMPFVSNRMNSARVDASVLYYLPRPTGLALKLGLTRTLVGRNVGEATTIQGGLFYTLHF